jgi:hypothetical protein
MVMQMLVESVLQRADVLLVGDPEVLAQMGELPADAGIISTPLGNVVLLRRFGVPTETSGFGGVHVWVAGQDQVTEVTVSLRLDALEQEPSLVGEVDCPSSRVVVGTPDAVTAWGPEVEPVDGLVAQARAYREDRRHCGLIVVARVPAGPHRVFLTEGALVVDCTSRLAQPELLLARSDRG